MAATDSEPTLSLTVGTAAIELTPEHFERLFADAELSLEHAPPPSKTAASPASNTNVDADIEDADTWEEINTNMEANTADLAIRFVSYYGLKSPDDVIKFLKSEGGKATLTMIQEKLAEMAAMQERALHELSEKERLAQRIMAFLLMGLLARSEAQTERLNIEAEHRIEDIRGRAASTETTTASTSTSAPREIELRRSLDAYDQTSDALQDELDKKLAEAAKLEKQLEKELLKIKNKTDVINYKYGTYTTHVTQIYAAVHGILPSTTISPEQLQGKIQALTSMLEKLTEKLQLDAKEITLFVDRGEIDKARSLMLNSNARNLEVGVLKDILAVIRGDKVLYNAQGQVTTKLKDAEFILPKNKKLVVDNGKYYLLKADQKFEDLTVEEKAQGEKAFLRLQPEIMGVKQLIARNKKLEMGQDQKKDQLLSRSEAMQHEIELLAGQLAQLQAARAGVVMKMQEAGFTAPVPTPSPKAVHSLADGYRRMLHLMRNCPSPDAIKWLKASHEGLEWVPYRTALNALQPGKPIPPALMTQLLRISEGDMAKRWRVNLGPIPDGTPSPESADARTAPTPFSMRPR
jgi:effector protein LidA